MSNQRAMEVFGWLPIRPEIEFDRPPQERSIAKVLRVLSFGADVPEV